MTTIATSCNKDCGGECPLLAEVREGRVVKITRNPAAPRTMVGCAKGLRMHRTLYAENRLKVPLVRSGPRGSGAFREVTWSEALDIVAERLAGIKAQHGNEAILHLGGSGAPKGAVHNTLHLTARFLSLFGGYTATRDNYSLAAADYVTPHILGTRMAGIDPATLGFSRWIILWGANTRDTRLGSETHAWLREARRRGVDITVVDPRRSSTVCDLEADWLPVRPGTDSALMMAVLYMLLTEDLVDREFIARYSVGFERLEKHVLGQGDDPAKTPEWAAALCGVPRERIVQFATRYGQSHPVALIPGPSIQRTIGGEEAIRLAVALQVATGNLGIPGGSTGALTWGTLPTPRIERMRAPENPSRAAVPVVRWPDAILEGRAGGYDSDIKAIYNVGGNFAVQGSDVRKSMRALASLDFAVCHELFLTPTARTCDVVLPVTTPLEREDVIIPAGGNYLLYSGKAVEPLYDTKNDYDIFCELAGRLGFLAEYSQGRSAEDWVTHLIAQSEIPDSEDFYRTGIYLGSDRNRVGLADFVADPTAHPLNTPSGLVEIASEAYRAAGFSAVPECRILEAKADYPLRLVTPHARTRIHSQGGDTRDAKSREPHWLWMHPRDAQARGVMDEQQVLVRSSEGTLLITAHVTEDILPGVVSLAEGVWPQFGEDGIDRAGSANVLTSTEPTLPSQGTRTHSVLVEVTPSG